MPIATLIDAGPLIAALNPRDRDHARCVVFLTEFKGMFVTTWPVVTEASHMLSGSIDSQLALLKWIERGGLDVRHVEIEAVRQMIVYTEKYRDRPMDLADASLVALATQMGRSEIVSIDSDFDIYQLPNNSRLKNLLAGAPEEPARRCTSARAEESESVSPQPWRKLARYVFLTHSATDLNSATFR